MKTPKVNKRLFEETNLPRFTHDTGRLSALNPRFFELLAPKCRQRH